MRKPWHRKVNKDPTGGNGRSWIKTLSFQSLPCKSLKCDSLPLTTYGIYAILINLEDNEEKVKEYQAAKWYDFTS